MKERLFKKNVLNVKPFFVHVVQVMDDVVLHVSFVHVFNICCNEHIWYVHVNITCCDVKKMWVYNLVL